MNGVLNHVPARLTSAIIHRLRAGHKRLRLARPIHAVNLNDTSSRTYPLPSSPNPPTMVRLRRSGITGYRRVNRYRIRSIFGASVRRLRCTTSRDQMAPTTCGSYSQPDMTIPGGIISLVKRLFPFSNFSRGNQGLSLWLTPDDYRVRRRRGPRKNRSTGSELARGFRRTTTRTRALRIVGS